MPKKKIETLVHLDIDELAHKTTPIKEEEDTSLGGILRARRIKKRWEIEDVARKLRIKPVYLEALEQGHYYAFPARTYGVGFLRSYSKLLDLDPDKMTALFNQETTEEKEQPIDLLVVEKHFSLPSFKFIFAVLFLFLVSYAVWYGIAKDYYPALLKQKMWLFEDDPIANEPVLVVNEEQIPTEPEPVEEPIPLPPAVEPEPIKIDPPQVEEGLTEVNPAVYSASVAFVATDTVWVGLKNITTDQLLVSKKFVKNESFIPETSINELAISTGRPKLLDLYINGKKVKTFGRETWLPLAGFAETSQKTDNE